MRLVARPQAAVRSHGLQRRAPKTAQEALDPGHKPTQEDHDHIHELHIELMTFAQHVKEGRA